MNCDIVIIQEVILVQWNMDTLEIVSYDNMNCLHRKFKRELIRDSQIFIYFKNTIEKLLTKSDNSQQLCFETAYLIAEFSNLIGYLYLGKCDFNGVLLLDYAVHGDYRGHKLGIKILRETRKFLIANMEKVNTIDLAIHKSNVWSINTALGADFEFHRQVDDIKHYRH